MAIERTTGSRGGCAAQAQAGDVTCDATSVGDNGPGGFLLSDAAVDWIEETANHETDSDG